MSIPENARYLVIETYERNVDGIHLADTMKNAVRIANDLLRKHCDTLGYAWRCEKAEQASSRGEEPDGIQFASPDCDNAFCNWYDMDWDAHIRLLPEALSEPLDGEAASPTE